MRQMISSGSVKAFWIDRDKTIENLKQIAHDAMRVFPEIKEIYLVGSLARAEHTGLSDLDLAIVADGVGHLGPVERMKPYYEYFYDKIHIGFDIFVFTPEEKDSYIHILEGGVLLGSRDI